MLRFRAPSRPLVAYSPVRSWVDCITNTYGSNLRQAQEVVPYSVSMTLGFPRGPDPVLIQSAVEAAVRAYAAERYRINTIVFRAGLTAAAKVGGVENVILTTCGAQRAGIGPKSAR
jgi:hypothetical protein